MDYYILKEEHNPSQNMEDSMMNTFRIRATFRRVSAYEKNARVQAEAPTGEIILVTNRCNVEALLSGMNVDTYQIVDCDNKLQIMQEVKKIPDYYYEKV